MDRLYFVMDRLYSHPFIFTNFIVPFIVVSAKGINPEQFRHTYEHWRFLLVALLKFCGQNSE